MSDETVSEAMAKHEESARVAAARVAAVMAKLGAEIGRHARVAAAHEWTIRVRVGDHSGTDEDLREVEALAWTSRCEEGAFVICRGAIVEGEHIGEEWAESMMTWEVSMARDMGRGLAGWTDKDMGE